MLQKQSTRTVPWLVLIFSRHKSLKVDKISADINDSLPQMQFWKDKTSIPIINMILNNLKEKSLIKINQLNLRQSIFNLREDTQITLTSLPQWKKGSPISEKKHTITNVFLLSQKHNTENFLPPHSSKNCCHRFYWWHNEE